MGDMKMGKITLAIFFVIISFSNLQAQVCSEILSNAEDEYEIGHLYAIPDLLQDCLDRGFSKEEKIRAYRLLTLTYLFIDEPEKADQAYLNLLKLSPEYQPNKLTDPIELFYLHDNFITTPYFSLYLLKIGTNRSLPKIFRNFNPDGMGELVNIFSESDSDQELIRGYQHNYNSSWGFNIGSGIEYGFSQRFSVGADLMLMYQQYRSNENILGDYTNQSFSEGMWWIDLPIYFKYNFPNVKYKPYFFSGFQSNLLFSTFSSNMISTWEQDGTNIPKEVFVDFNDQRKNLNFSVLFGAGAKYKVGINYLALEVRYSLGITNLSINEQRYADNSTIFDPNDRLMYDALYIDNDFGMNNLSFTINYIKPIYKPRKKK